MEYRVYFVKGSRNSEFHHLRSSVCIRTKASRDIYNIYTALDKSAVSAIIYIASLIYTSIYTIYSPQMEAF